MALNDIKFIKGQGGLAATMPNEDYKSGILFLRSYTDLEIIPATPFTTSVITSLADAVSKGISEGNYPEEYYVLKEFFRIQPNSAIWVAFGSAEDADFDFSEIQALQNLAEGSLRQVGVVTFSAYDRANIAVLQAVADTLFEQHQPLSILYAGDLRGIILSSLADLRTEASPNVSIVIGMDGGNEGKALYDTNKFAPGIGAVLGAVSKALVHESIAWVAEFKMSSDELDKPAFTNGDLVSETDKTMLDQLHDRGYLFFRKHVGIAGSYVNENSTCDLITSDYAYINNVRTIDKATRAVRATLLQKLNSPLTLTGSGKLDTETVVDWENTAKRGLEKMVKDGEISGYAVKIDPDQDIAGTSLLKVNITLVIRGVARNVEVYIGYGTL